MAGGQAAAAHASSVADHVAANPSGVLGGVETPAPLYEQSELSLRLGDRVSFFVEELNGFLSADGFTEDSVDVRCLRADEICLPRFESCVFQVQIKQNYHAKVELESFLEHLGVEQARAEEELSGPLLHRFRSLAAKATQEKRQNAEDIQIYFGRELRHSTPVQLLHVQSQKYIKVCLDNAADAEGSNISVVLTNAGAASCFRFCSRHNLKLADDPVCHLDTIFLVPEDLADTHFLNCEVELAKLMLSVPLKTKHRVSALLTGMTCLVQKYARDEISKAPGHVPEGPGQFLAASTGPVRDDLVPVRCGQVVRLFHPLLDVFLATSPAATSSSSLILLEDGNGFGQPGANSRFEQPSAYTMWIVESVNPTQGVPLLYDQCIRLRNLATDSYLCPNRNDTTVVCRELPAWSMNGRSKQTMLSSACFFRRLPEENVNDQRIRKNSVVWIHFLHSVLGQSMGDRFLQTSGTTASPSVGLGKKIGPSDGFVVHPVPDDQLRSSFQIVSVARTVREYILLIREKGFCLETDVETLRIIQILREFMKMLTTAGGNEILETDAVKHVQGTDPLSRSRHMREMREIHNRQSVIRELQLMDNLVELIDFQSWAELEKEREKLMLIQKSIAVENSREAQARFVESQLHSTSTQLKHSINNLRHNVDMATARELCEVVFQLLGLATKENERNGVHLSQSIDILLHHYTGFDRSSVTTSTEPETSYLKALQQCVINIYADNSLVLSSLEERSLGVFVNLLAGQQTLNPTYVKFMYALVQYKQKAVVHSTRILVDLLLKEPAINAVPQTTLRGDEIVVCMPNIGGISTWLHLEAVLLDPVHADYYNEFIKLAGIMCRGRSKTSEKILARLIDASVFSMHVCTAFLMRKSIPMRTRALFTELMRDAFIDCNPQRNRCSIETLQVWPDIYSKPVLPNEPFPTKYGGELQPLILKSTILEFIENNDVQGLDPEKDAFGLAIINLLHHLVLYGFFNHTVEWLLNHEFIHQFPFYRERMECLLSYLDPGGDRMADGSLEKEEFEVEILVQPIILMLDPSTDHVPDGKRLSEVTIVTKRMICVVLDMICRIRLRVRMNRLLQVYASDLEKGLVLESRSKWPNNQTTKVKNQVKIDTKRPQFEQVLEIIQFDNSALTNMLGELLKYGDEELDNKALKLMLLIYGQRDELVQALKQSVLLVNQTVINVYLEHRAILYDTEELVFKLGLIVDEVNVKREEERIKKVLAEQQAMLDDEVEVEEAVQPKASGFLGMIGLDALSETVANLNVAPDFSNVGQEYISGGLQAISRLGGGLSMEGLKDGLAAGLDVGKLFSSDRTEMQRPNQRMSVGMMARLSRRKNDALTDSKKIGTRTAKKLKGRAEDEEEESHDVEDEKTLKFTRFLQRERLDADRELKMVLVETCTEITRHVSHLVNDFTSGNVKLPLIKLQHGLFDLQVHICALDILRAISSDLTLLEMPAVASLLTQTCTLLTYFVKDNGFNASLVNTEIDQFLKLMDHPRALDFGIDQVLAALYFNNRTLCTQAPDKIEKKIIPLICGSARRYPYLKLLTVLMAPAGVAIKRNQARILKMLHLQRDKTLFLFDGNNGIDELKLLLRRRDYLDPNQSTKTEARMRVAEELKYPAQPHPQEKKGKTEADKKQSKTDQDEKRVRIAGAKLYDPVLNLSQNYDSEVLYFIYTLKLFKMSCLNNNNDTEQICCKLVPTKRCAELITASWCIGELKIAVLEFLEQGHMVQEKSASNSIAHDENIWVTFDYFASVLLRIMDPNEKRSYCLPLESPTTTSTLTLLFLRAARVFFGHFRIQNAKDTELAIADRVFDATVKYWAECSKLPSEHLASSDMLSVMNRNGVHGNESSRRLARTLLEANRMNLIEKNADAEVGAFYTKESALFPSFVETLEERMHAHTELKELIHVCMSQTRSVEVITQQLASRQVHVWLKRKYLIILQTLWETLAEQHARIDKSVETIRLDIVIAAILELVSKGTEIKACLNLANSLLSRGGKQVQKHFLIALSQRGQPEIFFRQLETCIEIAAEESREQKASLGQALLHMCPEPGSRHTLEEILNTYNKSDDGNAPEQTEDHMDLTESSSIVLVLQFLQNLCEGHFHEMQKLMRVQHQDHSFDIVSSVAQLVIEWSEKISPLNIDVTKQGFETLTEFMQGPNLGNILALLQTGIIESINSIVRNSHTDIDGVYYPQEYLDKVRELKESVVTNMLAMMEASTSSEGRIPLSIMESLDLDGVLEFSLLMHRKWHLNRKQQIEAGLNINDPVLAQVNAATIATGFKYYILLRYLADFDGINSSNIKAPAVFSILRDDTNPAILYYSQQVGSLEIARPSFQTGLTEMIKVYFQVPNICNQITRQMKQNILWDVDRTNDVTRLRDYFRRVDDLYFDMKYQEWIQSNSFTMLVKRVGSICDIFYLGNVLLINILLLTYFRWRDPLESDPDASWQEMQQVDLSGQAQIALESVLPSVQLVLEFVMVINYTMTRIPTFVRKQFKKAHLETGPEDAEGLKIPFEYEKIPRDMRFFAKYALFSLRDNNFYTGQCFVWRLSTLAIALTINTISVTDTGSGAKLALLFYFALLWEVFPRSKQIGFVIKAVYEGGHQLLALLGMILVFCYMFGVVGFIYFPDKFQFRRADIVDGMTAQNNDEGWGNSRAVPIDFIWKGVLMVVDQGVRKNDVGEALDKFIWPTPCPDPAEYGCMPCPGYSRTYDCIKDRMDDGKYPCTNPAWQQKLDGYLELAACANVWTSWPESKIFIRIIYTFLFFVFVSAIGLEIVFGVIVDSFKALREEREEKLKDIQYKCFICGINRDVFDAKLMDVTGGKTGFDAHTENDHNMWAYMYYLIHIREVENQVRPANVLESSPARHFYACLWDILT